jgi:hypothetical protein
VRYHAESREPGNEKAKEQKKGNDAKVRGVYKDTKPIGEKKNDAPISNAPKNNKENMTLCTGSIDHHP